MPVSLLTTEQRECFGRYRGAPTPEDLAHYFHQDDTDRTRIAKKRGDHNRLGFALQLGTVRYLGAFLDERMEVPPSVVRMLAAQLGIAAETGIDDYGAVRLWICRDGVWELRIDRAGLSDVLRANGSDLGSAALLRRQTQPKF